LADGSRQQLKPGETAKSQQPLFVGTYLLLTIAVVLLASATAFGFYKMRQESELARYNSQAALWLVVSFEREYHILDTMLWRYTIGDTSLSPEELLTQYDVLWSRIELMQQGGHARPLQQIVSFESIVPVAMAMVQRHENSVFAAIPAGEPIPESFLEEFRGMADPIHKFMIDTHLNRGWMVNLRESQIKDTRLAIYLTLAGTLVSTLMLFIITLVQMRARHESLVRTVKALKQSESDRNALSEEVRRRQSVEKDRKNLLLDLEARNEALEGYAYTISHDLKSPLYTIQGFTGFLERDLAQGDSDKMQKDLEQIREAVTTMSRMLDDILNLSRVNLSNESAQPLTLAEIIGNAVKLVSREIEENGVTLKIEPNLPDVHAAPQRLTEVYQNLISNSTKFIGSQANPVIEIGARSDGDWVYCFVSDNGIGIAAEYQERVFNLFERLDSHTQGTGVGLAIVKRIIEHLGGEIWIESDGPGSGSRFEFTLPASPPR